MLPPLLPGFELATFRSQVRRSYQQAIPAPVGMVVHHHTPGCCTQGLGILFNMKVSGLGFKSLYLSTRLQ